MQQWRFGDITITKVIDLIDPFEAARAYPGIDPAAFTPYLGWLAPDFYDPAAKAILLSFHSYVVRTPRRTIVVDTCVGDHKSRSGVIAKWHLRTGPWLANLAAAGVRPEQVDCVMCTHLHADHVGWNTRLENGRWVPTFPKARYVFHRRELESVQARLGQDAYNSPSYVDSVLPVIEAGLVDLVDSDHAMEDGVTIRPTPGHSPGHYCVEVADKGRRAVMSGDLLHNPVQIAHPEWITTFCQDKQAAVVQREKFVDSMTDIDITLLAAHFGGKTAGRIVSTGGGRRMFRTV